MDTDRMVREIERIDNRRRDMAVYRSQARKIAADYDNGLCSREETERKIEHLAGAIALAGRVPEYLHGKINGKDTNLHVLSLAWDGVRVVSARLLHSLDVYWTIEVPAREGTAGFVV